MHYTSLFFPVVMHVSTVVMQGMIQAIKRALKHHLEGLKLLTLAKVEIRTEILSQQKGLE
jgi:hypothetical protein